MPAKKTVAKKAAPRKASVKKTVAEKAAPRKASVKKTVAKKAAPRKASVKKTVAKKAGVKTAARKAGVKRTAPRAATPRTSAGAIRARRGDLIVIDSPQVGTPPREGEVLGVIHGEVRDSYRVKWADGHESLISPAAGAVTIVRA